MASETGIVNAGIIKLGITPILDITQDTKTARLCKRRYYDLRDKLLRTYPWSFAIKRTELALISAAPTYKFSYAHQLPSNSLRLLDIDERCTDYRREGDTIVSNNSEVFIRYIQAITDPNKMDVAFRESLSAKIAQELCMILADNQNLYKIMKADFLDSITEARNTSAIERGSDYILAEQWIKSRYAGTSGPEGFYRE